MVEPVWLQHTKKYKYHVIYNLFNDRQAYTSLS
jgi:hypothetical protein